MAISVLTDMLDIPANVMAISVLTDILVVCKLDAFRSWVEISNALLCIKWLLQRVNCMVKIMHIFAFFLKLPDFLVI